MKHYLYIKTSPFGLKYLGKTTKNPYTYMGSGKIWKRHIVKHNLTPNDIITEIILETENVDELIEKGIEVSEIYDVVKSNEWANLRLESGDGGDTSNHIDFTNPVFHKSERAKHLNEWLNTVTDAERKKILRERISKVNFEERSKKTKENTDWDSWKKSIENRKTDYSKFIKKIHEKNKKPVIQFDLDGNFIQEFDCAANAAKSLGFNNGGNITNCCKGRCKSSMGYKWKYKN